MLEMVGLFQRFAMDCLDPKGKGVKRRTRKVDRTGPGRWATYRKTLLTNLNTA